MLAVTGLVILAAGASTRLGEPKQLLSFEGQTLLQRAIQAALASGCAPIAVVLGAKAAELLQALAGAPVTVVQNPAWEEGMALSIRCGLRTLLHANPELSGCIFMVCDQPFAVAAVLKKLVQARQDGANGIVASAYKDTLGTPVLFDKKYFPELLALRGQEGAKKLIIQHSSDVTQIAFAAGAIDIDTAADYSALLQSGRSQPE